MTGKLLRTVQLAEDQRKVANRSLRGRKAVADFLRDLAMEMLESCVDQEDEAWRQLHEIADSDPHTEEIKVDLLTGTLRVFEREGEDE